MTYKWKGKNIEEIVRQATSKVVLRRTENVLSIAVRSILSGEKTGRMYGTHQASAPGEAPANEYGTLVRSGKTTYDIKDISGKVTFSAKHALPLEYGTERMEPRPYLRPALAQGTDGIEEELADELRGRLS